MIIFKKIASKFNLLKEIKFDQIIDLIILSSTKNNRYGDLLFKDLLFSLSYASTIILNIKSQFKTLILSKLNDQDMKTQMIKLNFLIGHVTKILNTTDKEDLDSILPLIQYEYITKLINYIDYQWKNIENIA